MIKWKQKCIILTYTIVKILNIMLCHVTNQASPTWQILDIINQFVLNKHALYYYMSNK